MDLHRTVAQPLSRAERRTGRAGGVASVRVHHAPGVARRGRRDGSAGGGANLKGVREWFGFRPFIYLR